MCIGTLIVLYTSPPSGQMAAAKLSTVIYLVKLDSNDGSTIAGRSVEKMRANHTRNIRYKTLPAQLRLCASYGGP